jgi:hypothetical protein
MLTDSPTHYYHERVECSIQAANHYHIPPLIMLAVAEQEGGKPGQKTRNSNGTYDYGAMQINTVSLADLRPYGINENHVLAEGCYPYFLAGESQVISAMTPVIYGNGQQIIIPERLITTGFIEQCSYRGQRK